MMTVDTVKRSISINMVIFELHWLFGLESIALFVLRRTMSASDVAPEVAIFSSIHTPLPLKMYTSASESSIGSHWCRYW